MNALMMVLMQVFIVRTYECINEPIDTRIHEGIN